MVSLDLIFDINGRRRNNGALISPTLIFSTISVCITSEGNRTKSCANKGICGCFWCFRVLKSLPISHPGAVPRSKLETTELHYSFMSEKSPLCVLRHNFLLKQDSIFLFLIRMSEFIAFTTPKKERYSPVSRWWKYRVLDSFFL